MTNYYKILGVPDFASQDEIKKAFRKLSKKFHPDVNDGDEFFANKFRELKEAYDFLSDDAKRASLDRFLKSGSSHNSFDEELKRRQYEQQQREQRAKAEREQREREERLRKENEEREHKFREKQNKTYNQNTNKTQEYSNQKGRSSLGYILIGLFIIGLIYVIFDKYNSDDVDSNYFDSNNKENVSTYSLPKTSNYSSPIPTNYPKKRNLREKYEEIKNDPDPFPTSLKIGDSKKRVLKVMGNPTSVTKLESINEEILSYGSSSITLKNGKIYEYFDMGNLKISYEESPKKKNLRERYEEIKNDPDPFPTSLKIGDSKKRVLKVMGNPTSVTKLESINEEILSYGSSSITLKNGKIYEYFDMGNLKISYEE